MLLLLAIGCKLPVLWHPEMALVTEHSQFLWVKLAGFITEMLGHHAFLITFFALFNIVGQALMLNRITNIHHLLPHSSYLPAMGYVLMTSLFVEWNQLSAALIANWFLLATYSALFKLHTEVNTRKELFNIGCFLSLSAMLVFPNIFLLGLLFIALRLLRPFKAAEWVVGLLGIMTPLYFLAAGLYLTDHMELMAEMIAIGFVLPEPMAHPEVIIVPLALVAVLFFSGAFFLNGFMSRMLTLSKKLWWVIISGLFLGLLAGSFTLVIGYNQWLAALLPGVWIISNLWFAEIKQWIIRGLFYLLIVVVIFVQWFPH